ncbi:MAG TPA: DNA-processing protein DprA [Caulobacteraceae bacterium]|jgi:DNA processing protein|nr:DNA-processing protein DprA [Caulobacteraceae bacterium]
MTSDARERLDWLRLARTEAVGAVTFAHLIRRYRTAGAALEAIPDLARGGGRAAPLRIPSPAEAQAELAAGQALGARLVLAGEPDFPRLLAVLDAPPPLLWVLGDAALMTRRTVAIVGARIASSAGRRFANDLARDLGCAGYVVVSGMARGIDAAAHQGALETGTIAALAGGVDDVYPPDNAALIEAVKAKGCLVSERTIGHAARAQDFPRRNRIISGLSLGVVVVEAEIRSGSLITARLAGEQGRDVFAVPGSPIDPRARGSNGLLRQGAFLVEEADDVLRVLDAQPGFSDPEQPTSFASDEPTEPLEVASLDRLESLLSLSPSRFDDLARDAGVHASAVAAALVELALAGRVELLPGGYAVRPSSTAR